MTILAVIHIYQETIPSYGLVEMYFFEIDENIEKLRTFLIEWHGTPYKHHAGKKGLECDCINLIAKGCEYLGKGHYDIQWYDKDWHLHNSDELLLNGLREQLKGDELPPEKPIDGDIILYRFGKTISHAGWYLAGYVYQALFRVGVERRTWNDAHWHKRRALIFRILA